MGVTVQQTLTGITIAPGDAAVLQGDTQQFSATGFDQFGNDMTTQPSSFTWGEEKGEEKGTSLILEGSEWLVWRIGEEKA